MILYSRQAQKQCKGNSKQFKFENQRDDETLLGKYDLKITEAVILYLLWQIKQAIQPSNKQIVCFEVSFFLSILPNLLSTKFNSTLTHLALIAN